MEAVTSWKRVLQGQASDIIIQANEIKKVKENLHSLYVRHTRQTLDVIGREQLAVVMLSYE